jgi:hypothetical protein
MPTDAGTVTNTAVVSGADALGEAATATAVEVDSAAEALADAGTAELVLLAGPEEELVVAVGTLTNPSPRTVRPVIVVFGPGQDPYVQNQTTGETWRLDGVTLAEADHLVADMATRSIMVEGEPVGARRRGSDWLTLAPGDNTIVAGASGVGDGFRIQLTWDAVAL